MHPSNPNANFRGQTAKPCLGAGLGDWQHPLLVIGGYQPCKVAESRGEVLEALVQGVGQKPSALYGHLRP